MRFPFAALLATLATVGAGCLGASDAPAGADDGFDVDKVWALEPGGFGEANFELPEGGTVTASYASDGGPVRWDVHGHDPDGAVRTFDSGLGKEGTVSFTAPVAGGYSILWKNPPASEALILTVSVEGAGAFSGFQP